jgi:glycosyltransferase involved in cell wall biosynthesis
MNSHSEVTHEYPSPQPRILMLLNRYLPVVGGTERQAAALAGELNQRGYPITIVTRRIKAEHPAHETINGIAVRRLSPVGLSHAANALMLGRLMGYLVGHAHEYDILHVHGVGPVGLAGVLAGAITHKPVLIKSADCGNLSRQDIPGITPSFYSRLVRRVLLPPALWKRLIGSVDQVVAINHAIAREAASMGLGDRVTAIPNGVNTGDFVPAAPEQQLQRRRELGLPDDARVVLSAGRLVRRKRLDVALRAVAQIGEDCPDCLLVLLGSGKLQVDDAEDDLKALAESRGISERVRFPGLVDNILPYLQAADAFIFPSEKEGMPNVVLEAMAAGLPIIASQIDGVVELLDESSGWLVPVGDAAGLAGALREALTDPDLAHQRGQRARHEAETRFSLQAVADQYEALYAKIRRE